MSPLSSSPPPTRGVATMEEEWHYFDDTTNTQPRPFSVNELGKLYGASSVTASTLVWRDGLEDWSPLWALRSLHAQVILEAWKVSQSLSKVKGNGASDEAHVAAKASRGAVVQTSCTPESMTTTEERWYYLDDATNAQRGPFSVNELGKLSAASSLTNSTLVWRDGLEDWCPLSALQSLHAQVILEAWELPMTPPRALVGGPYDTGSGSGVGGANATALAIGGAVVRSKPVLGMAAEARGHVGERHETWHQEMDALAQAARTAVAAAEQAAERVAAAAASAEAAAGRVVAAVETTSTFRSAEAVQPALAPVAQPPAADFPPSETTNAVAPVSEAYMASQMCAHCNERRPLYKSASGVYMCGFHHAVSLSLLDAHSAGGGTGGNGDKRATGIWAAATAPRPTRAPGSECVLQCGNTITVSTSGSRCASGHALCADCTAHYVEHTLLPRGIVWWDRIKCVDLACEAHMQGTSVQRCISRRLVERIDAAQLEVVPMIGPEARRERERVAEAARRTSDRAAKAARREEDLASEATVAKTTKPCPNCSAPTEKDGGCQHMACKQCNQDYYWDCHCTYPGRHTSCVPR